MYYVQYVRHIQTTTAVCDDKLMNVAKLLPSTIEVFHRITVPNF